VTRVAIGALIALLLILAVSLWLRGLALEAERTAVREAAVEAENIRARADTLRTHYLNADSSRGAAERRAEQLALERDELDVRLRTESRARATVEARVRDLQVLLAAAVTVDSADVRSLAVTVRDPPHTVDLAVSLPPPPDSGRVSMVVHLDPIDLIVTHRCGAPGVGGIRPAHVSAEGPSWLTIAGIRAVVDPDACNPPPYSPGWLERIRIAAPYAAAGAGAGVIIGAWLTR
jgi:hypothetical protein